MEFQGDTLSDAERNDIREAVMGEIILEATPPAERAKAVSVALQNSCEFGVCKRLGRGDTLSKKDSSRDRSEILCGEDNA